MGPWPASSSPGAAGRSISSSCGARQRIEPPEKVSHRVAVDIEKAEVPRLRAKLGIRAGEAVDQVVERDSGDRSPAHLPASPARSAQPAFLVVTRNGISVLPAVAARGATLRSARNGRAQRRILVLAAPCQIAEPAEHGLRPRDEPGTLRGLRKGSQRDEILRRRLQPDRRHRKRSRRLPAIPLPNRVADLRPPAARHQKKPFATT